ncbi:putative motility protein [Acidovorax sp. HDW3]|uniref:YjfB family protein n=1 Tax=Acidovorax sp. HDW3 TaxID=2714923 RepID=UPI00140D580C|nr:YjfB family protein [Acidovorax sp. HDW3]QIL44098.1 putative motility protein [Acidovorax sp. HDW3]
MDVSLSNAIMHTANALQQSKTADAVQVAVLKKSMDVQKTAAATLLQALPQPPLASSGTLGTQVNTFA